MPTNTNKYDFDHNGKVSKDEIVDMGAISELELREEKAFTQKRMAWTAMISMLVFTVVLFSPIVTDGRVKALADLLGLFYIAQAGVVGAYMGIQAWMSNTQSRYGSSSYSGSYRAARTCEDPSETDDKEPVKGR